MKLQTLAEDSSCVKVSFANEGEEMRWDGLVANLMNSRSFFGQGTAASVVEVPEMPSSLETMDRPAKPHPALKKPASLQPSPAVPPVLNVPVRMAEEGGEAECLELPVMNFAKPGAAEEMVEEEMAAEEVPISPSAA
jgi:hypothetical protein